MVLSFAFFSINKCFPTLKGLFVIFAESSSNYYVSPMKWGDILFLAPLSVCLSVCSSVRLSVRLSVRPSVCLTVFRVRSISFEPLVGFTNNFALMTSMMRRCAVPMFDQGWFKVKVTI